MDIKTLRDAVTLVKPAVDARSSYPSLGGVKIEAFDSGHVELTAVSRDITIQTKVAATVTRAGTVVLNHKLLAGSVKGKGPISFGDMGDDTVQVTNGISQRLRTLPLEDFPRVDTVDEDHVFSVPCAALARVVLAASSDNDRPILTGVLLEGDQVVATDSYRLHVEPTREERFATPLLVPGRAVAAIVKATKGTGDVLGSVSRDGYTARFVTDAGTYTTRLLEGQYPNYGGLIPKGYPYEVRFDREAMLHAIDAVSKIRRDSTSPVRFNFGDQTKVEVSMIIPDVGHLTAEVPCTSNAHVPFEQDLGMNPAYAGDCLRSLPDDKVRFSFQDFLKPLVFGSDTPGVVRLLMPVKLA